MGAPLPDLGGTRALVTGGTRGIGAAIAAALVAAGARVVLTGRERARAEAAAASLGGGEGAACGIRMDVSDADSVATAVRRAGEALGGIDVLVNNAGLGVRFLNERYMTQPQPFWEVDPERFRRLLETNVDGYFLCARAVVPAMLAAGWGRIVNVSINEATMRFPHFVPYGPSRAATDAMTMAMAAELEGSGTTVNLLAPGGPTATGMITEEASPEFRSRLLDPEIMGPAACWLASTEADGVNGEKIVAKDWSWDASRA